jgi:hypothetical protein
VVQSIGPECKSSITKQKKRTYEFLLPFPVWGTGNASLSFLPTVPLLINFTVTFTKKKEFKKHLLL